MELKAYSLNGPAQLKLIPAVQVQLQDTKDTIADSMVPRLFKWLMANEIYPVLRGGISGGGLYIGHYTTGDAEKIRAWLLEQGVVEIKD